MENLNEKEETNDTTTYRILSHHFKICHIARAIFRENLKLLIGLGDKSNM